MKNNALDRKNNCVLMLLLLAVLSGCASSGALESYNRGMYQTNKTIDKYTLKPLATAYQAVTPDPVERSVNNVFSNVGEVGTMVNSLLQGKLHNAAVSSARLVWNTTLGLGGLFDVATAMNLTADEEDFGQTLRTWGVPAGPYVVLPILGPSTVTDSVGLVGDYFTSPTYHYDWPDHRPRTAVAALGVINTRVQLLGAEKILAGATTDEYSFVKSAYLQRRDALTRDGQGDSDIDDAFDELFDDE